MWSDAVIRPTDPYVYLTANTALSGQFADKPTRGQSIHGLVNSQTSQKFLPRRKAFYLDEKPTEVIFLTGKKLLCYENRFLHEKHLCRLRQKFPFELCRWII